MVFVGCVIVYSMFTVALKEPNKMKIKNKGLRCSNLSVLMYISVNGPITERL